MAQVATTCVYAHLKEVRMSSGTLRLVGERDPFRAASLPAAAHSIETPH